MSDSNGMSTQSKSLMVQVGVLVVPILAALAAFFVGMSSQIESQGVTEQLHYERLVSDMKNLETKFAQDMGEMKDQLVKMDDRLRLVEIQSATGRGEG